MLPRPPGRPARRALRHARLRPDSVLFNKELGGARLASADLEGFARVASRVLELDPAELPSRLSLADALIALDRKDDARAVLEQGLAILPGPHPIMMPAASPFEPVLTDKGFEGYRTYVEAGRKYGRYA